MSDADSWQPVLVLMVLVGMLLGMFFEVWTPTLVMIFALLIVWNCGIINTDDALSGFSNSGMITVGCLFVVVQGVEKSHVFQRIAGRVFGQDTSKQAALLRLMLLSFIFSSIFNNTPIVAILLPITRDWARSRGFAPSEFLIPLSFSSILGGVLTMIGTSTNLVIAGLLDDDDREPFGFVDPAILGFPLGLLSIVYMLFLAPILLPNDKGGLFREIRDHMNEMVTEMEVMNDCPLVSGPVDKLLEKTNLTRHELIKIRRRVTLLEWDEYQELKEVDFNVPQVDLPTSGSGVAWNAQTAMMDENGNIVTEEDRALQLELERQKEKEKEIKTKYYASQSGRGKKPRTLAIGRGRTLNVSGANDDNDATKSSKSGASAITSASTASSVEAGASSVLVPSTTAASAALPTLSTLSAGSAISPNKQAANAPPPPPGSKSGTLGSGSDMTGRRPQDSRSRRTQNSPGGSAEHSQSESYSSANEISDRSRVSSRYDLVYMNKTSKLWRLGPNSGPLATSPTAPRAHDAKFQVPCDVCLCRKDFCRCAELAIRGDSVPFVELKSPVEHAPPKSTGASAGLGLGAGTVNTDVEDEHGDKSGAPIGGVGYDFDADEALQHTAAAQNGRDGKSFRSYRSRENSDDIIHSTRRSTMSGEDTHENMTYLAARTVSADSGRSSLGLGPEFSEIESESEIESVRPRSLSRAKEMDPNLLPPQLRRQSSRDSFSRKEESASVPIKVTTAAGNLVGEVSGDNIIELAHREGSGTGDEDGNQRKKYVDIFPVPEAEVLEEGDIVFFMTGGGDALKKLYDKNVMKGLRILDASIYDLAGFGTDLVEVVLSRKNKFVGKPISNSGFGKYYGGSVVAVRNVGHKMEMAKGNLHAGDMVLLVMSEDALANLRSSFGKEFYVITRVGHLPPAVELWDYGGVGLFFVMLLALIFIPKNAASEVQIVMTTMMLMIGGNWVNAQEALQAVDFPLLGLIGAALSLARSVDKSGLASNIASFVKNTDMSPLGALYVVSILAMILTNVVTNNAAAALTVPIALSIADALEVSYKPYIMAVLYAASISFMTPIGYQTNTMIWGPGGYTFTDFMKIGIPLNIMYLMLSCALLPLVFPF